MEMLLIKGEIGGVWKMGVLDPWIGEERKAFIRVWRKVGETGNDFQSRGEDLKIIDEMEWARGPRFNFLRKKPKGGGFEV